jgi:hypothetical protein
LICALFAFMTEMLQFFFDGRQASSVDFAIDAAGILVAAVQYCALVLFLKMNSKQRKTLQTIFKSPTPANLEWRAIASLIKALGGNIKHGDGSRIRIDLKKKSLAMQ